MIHEVCNQQVVESGEDLYAQQLRTQLDKLHRLDSDGDAVTIRGLVRLFRRRAGYFNDVQQLVGKLNEVLMTETKPLKVQCEIDVFAYAFLKSAKNFDLFLPEIASKTGPYRLVETPWANQIKALEDLEREGIQSSEVDKVSYLALRRILARATARDERRSLATLLVNGPSTREDITADLDLPFSLGERILPTFESIGTLERREGDRYALQLSALPYAVFCLREVAGFDLLPKLD